MGDDLFCLLIITVDIRISPCAMFLNLRCPIPLSQVSLDAEDIRNEKVKVLRSMQPVQLDDVVLGQYKSRCVHHGSYQIM